MKYALIIDDSAVIRKVARRILEGLSFEVQEAKDGREGFDFCRDRMPDAIIVDHEMPMMNGYDFVRSLRRLENGHAPRVVFCTTENDVGNIARAIHSGADEYLLKPFDRSILTKKMADIGMA